MRLIGVDVGGTFTDAVLADTRTDRLAIHKVPTSPDDPSLGVMRAITELCHHQTIPLDSIALIYHGTTIATNALLEYKGATAGMMTTPGLPRYSPHRSSPAAPITTPFSRRFPGRIALWSAAAIARAFRSGLFRRTTRF